MTGELVRVERGEGLVRLILDRPDRGNALGPDLVAALSRAFAAAVAETPRLIVLSGTGRNFCTGFDLTDLDSLSDGDLLLRFVRVEALLQAVDASPVPTMAVAQGRVFGAGADVFVACDHRVAIDGASFCFPGPRFGLVLGSRRLGERIGQDAARAVLTSGRTLSSADAVAVGLAGIAIGPADIETHIAGVTGGKTLDPATVAALRAATSTSQPDADLAALVRSAARDGLKDRIRTYRAVTPPRLPHRSPARRP